MRWNRNARNVPQNYSLGVLMDRRSAVLGSTALAAAYALTPRIASGGSTVTRVNVTSLSSADAAVLQSAVALMMEKPASDPGSWDFLAATHQRLPFDSKAALQKAASENPGVAPWLNEVSTYIDFDKLGKVSAIAKTTYWSACIHRGKRGEENKPFKSGFFLAWHRVFLLNFEAHFLKAVAEVVAKSGGTTAIAALPYWDYYQDGTIPSMFRAPKLPDGTDNKLYISMRNSDLNLPKDPQSVSSPSMAAFKLKDFQTQVVKLGPFNLVRGFDGALEALPHDQIHGEVGGLMGTISTAAWDPLFWFHHANIDRLWQAWETANGVAKDVDQTWKDEPFVFEGVEGPILRRAGDLYGAALPYVYASLDVGGDPLKPNPVPKKPPKISTKPTPGKHLLALSVPQSLEVTNRGGTVTLPLPSLTSQKKLGALAHMTPPATSPPTSVGVVVEGLTITPEGRKNGFVFDVYVAAPVIGTAKPADPVRVGTINIFNLKVLGNQDTLRFDATEAVQELAKVHKTGSNLEVLLVQQTGTNSDGSSQVRTPSGPLIRIKSLYLDSLVNK